MVLEARGCDGHVRDRDGHVEAGGFRVRRVQLQRPLDVAEQAEIVVEAEVVEPPAYQRVSGIGGIGAGRDARDIDLAGDGGGIVGKTRGGQNEGKAAGKRQCVAQFDGESH